MSSSLGYSLFDSTIPLKDIIKNKHKSKKIKDTTKKSNIEAKLDDDVDDITGDFSSEINFPKMEAIQQATQPPLTNNHKPQTIEQITIQQPSKMDNKDSPYKGATTNNWHKNDYQKFIPQLSTTNQSSNSEDLSKKINYMIHLLEEQQDIKQSSLTEELVLYCFLGIFIIFLVDSFARVGRYVR